MNIAQCSVSLAFNHTHTLGFSDVALTLDGWFGIVFVGTLLAFGKVFELTGGPGMDENGVRYICHTSCPCMCVVYDRSIYYMKIK